MDSLIKNAEVLIMDLKKIGLFVGGALFGTAGVAILTSKDAKKVYTHGTAAVLRGKDSIMRTVTTLKENCGDIYEDATDINEKRYQEEAERKLEEAKALVDTAENQEQEELVDESLEG